MRRTFAIATLAALLCLQGLRAETSGNDRQKRFDYFFFEAVRQQNEENFDAAFDLYQHALEIDSAAPEVYYQLSVFYSQLKEDSVALGYMVKASKLNPDNPYYLERVAQAYSALQNFPKAIEAYEHLWDMDHNNTDVLQILLRLYQQQKDYKQMLATLNRIETAEGSSEQITMAKMQVYDMMNDKKAAYKELKSLAEEHPLDVSYQVMLGNWIMQNGKQRDAFKIFQQALKEEPGNAYAQSSLYDYYVATRQSQQAQTLLEELLTNPRTETATKATLLRQYIMRNERQGGDSTLVLRLFDMTLAQPQSTPDLAEMKAAYMMLKHMPQDSIDNAWRKVLAIAPDDATARAHLLQSLVEQQDWKEVAGMCRTAQEYNPDEMAFYYYEGVAEYQLKENDKALEAFRRGVSQINSESDASMVSDFYAIMGDILHEKGLAKEAYAAYDSCLQWKDDNISCLNNYAYFLSEESQDLQKAEQMSYRTIKAEPNNPTYLDTYAWILFRQKRFDEARKHIETALKNDTDSVQSAVLLEHAGDICANGGDMDAALKYWQESLEAGSESATLPKKIQMKKYIP